MTLRVESVPAWFVAWREGRCQSQRPPAQREQRGCQGYSGRPPIVSAVTEAQRPKANFLGLVEPERWPYDGCVRREPVLDVDRDPPRMIRRLGWWRYMNCGTPFFSDDVVGLRLCVEPTGCRAPRQE